MRSVVTRFAAIWLSILALGIYIVAYYTIGSDSTQQLVNLLLLGVAVTISASWWPAAMRALKRGASDDVSKVILTVWLAWTSLVVQRVYVIAVSFLDRPVWLANTPLSGIVAMFILIAGAYAIAAPVSSKDTPNKEKTWTLAAIIVGLVFIVAAVASIIMHQVA